MNQRPHILMIGNPILKIFQKLKCEIIEKYLRFLKRLVVDKDLMFPLFYIRKSCHKFLMFSMLE